MPGAAGKRTEAVTFSRLGAGTDDYGGESGSWSSLGSAKAEVIWGSGGEVRDAAREGGRQAATFRVLATAMTRGVSIKDKLAAFGADWDILAIVQRGRAELEFNAVRSV